MKRARKFILYIFLVLFSLVIILAVAAALSENRIARLALEQVSKATDVPIEVGDIEFSLLRNFPKATIRCSDVWVGTSQKDTLAQIGRLYVSVEAKPLLKQIFQIRKIELEDAVFNYFSDSTGASNVDFIMENDQNAVADSSSNAVFLNIEDLSLQNITLNYRDDKLMAGAQLFFEELELNGVINQEKYEGEVQGKAVLKDCAYASTNLYRMQQTDVLFQASYLDGVIGIDRAEIKIDNDAAFALTGMLTPGDSMLATLELQLERLDLAGVQKYLPDNLLRDAGIHNFAGNLRADAHISGILSDTIVPKIDVNFTLEDGRLKYGSYPFVRNLKVTGKASNGILQNNASGSLQISALSFQTDSSKVTLKGSLYDMARPRYTLNSELDLNLAEVAPFLPDSTFRKLRGKISASLTTKGTVPDSVSEEFVRTVMNSTRLDMNLSEVELQIDTSVEVSEINTKLTYEPGRLEIKQLQAYIPEYDLNLQNLSSEISGDFLIVDSLVARFDTLQATVGNSSFDLNGQLQNLHKPSYEIQGIVNIDLPDIRPYLPNNKVDSISGNFTAKLESAATIDPEKLDSHLYSIIFENSSFNLELNHITVQTPDSMLNIGNLSGALNYSNDSLRIDQLSADYQGMHAVAQKVLVDNVYTALLLNQPNQLLIHGNFYVDKFDYAFVEKVMSEDTVSAAETNKPGQPMNFTYKINGKLSAGSVKYENALFSDITSKFLVKENYYVFDSLRLKAFDGRALSSLKVEMQPDNRMVLFFKTNIDKMNTRQLVANFGEYMDYDEISANNVAGLLSTAMDGEIILKNYAPVYESLMLKGDLTIENGALFNVRPVMEVEKIKGIGLKNMDSLYFSTLNSSVFLFNNELYIPRTEIRTTSFDAMFLGMYSFGEDYAYHIRMFLGEVLSSKSKANLRKQMEEGGFSADDGKDVTRGRTSIYLVSKSENGKEKAGFDKKRDRANMVAKVNLQQQMVNLNFHPKLVKYETEEK